MMLALGVARDLGADHPGCVVVVLGAPHAADRAFVEELNLERASRRTVVRTGGCPDANRRTDASHRPGHATRLSGLEGRLYRLFLQSPRPYQIEPDRDDEDRAGDT